MTYVTLTLVKQCLEIHSIRFLHCIIEYKSPIKNVILTLYSHHFSTKMVDLTPYILYTTCAVMLIAGIYNFKKSQTFTWLILWFCGYHALTDILFAVTSHYGNNWFLIDLFLFPEWTIIWLIMIYTLNKKKTAILVFVSCTIILIISQIIKQPGDFWPKHMASMITTLSSAFVWVYFIKTVRTTKITQLKRFWMLLSITLYKSISSFILVLYELVPMEKYDFLPSIIISVYKIGVACSYFACIKASLCKQV